MDASRFLPLGLGLTIFSFFISALAFVPFIDLLYNLKFQRKKESECLRRLAAVFP